LGRGLRASKIGIDKAQNVRVSRHWTYEALGMEVLLSTATVRRFFSGKFVQQSTFLSICEALQLNWQEIVEVLPSEDNATSVKASSTEDKGETDVSRVERSIEFPPEYWEAGTSILSYFSRVLSFKYPNKKIKVRIEQEGLMLRMVIDTQTGEREEIEKTLEEYGLVVTGKIPPESFLSNPFEAMALKNKLEIADLELRQTRNFLDFTRDNSQQRIESLEVQVNRLHSIIEKGLKSGNHVIEAIKKMSGQDKSTYNLSHVKFGGGFAAEGGHQEGGQFNDYSIQVGVNLDEITKLIQSLKTAIQTFPKEQRVDIDIEIEDLRTDLSDEQRRNPERLGKRVRSLWLIACAIAVGVAGVADFSNNLLELSEKLNVPIPIELIQQNPHILPGS
jgi:DNA-binding Xre family transcriptional regulator